MDGFWIILTGCLVAASSALLGCFLLLRKMTMMGDAISHAVLPGIVLAYLVAQSRASIVMLLGAVVFGVVVTILIEVLNKNGRMQEDAAIGISFTWLFAIGIILISVFAGSVDLDQDCVLYGEIAYVPFDNLRLADGTNIGPRQVWILGVNALVILLFLTAAYKPLFISSFDPVFAGSMGLATAVWHYLLMGAVSLTTVLSFESVGAILVVAFLVGPAATAYLLTHSLPQMMAFSVGIGCLAAISGYFLAVFLNASIAGAMATMIGVIFALALGFSVAKDKLGTSKTNEALSAEVATGK